MPSQLPAFCWLFLIFSFLFFAIMVLQWMSCAYRFFFCVISLGRILRIRHYW
jgi:hypothetical protein